MVMLIDEPLLNSSFDFCNFYGFLRISHGFEGFTKYSNISPPLSGIPTTLSQFSCQSRGGYHKNIKPIPSWSKRLLPQHWGFSTAGGISHEAHDLKNRNDRFIERLSKFQSQIDQDNPTVAIVLFFSNNIWPIYLPKMSELYGKPD